MDGVTFEQIESEGRQEWLRSLQEELHAKTCRPQPVRRVKIPKPGGGERPLGTPTISYGTRLPAYRAVEQHVKERVRGFLRRRRKVSSCGAR